MRFLNGMPSECVYSPDDGGWYVEVWDSKGKDLHKTEIHAKRQDAVNAAWQWIENTKPVPRKAR